MRDGVLVEVIGVDSLLGKVIGKIEGLETFLSSKFEFDMTWSVALLSIIQHKSGNTLEILEDQLEAATWACGAPWHESEFSLTIE